MNEGDIDREERERILKLVRHIHNVTGHGSLSTLLKSLKHRGVSERILAVARDFECPVCEERKRTAPHRPATLETLAKKWQKVQCDLGSWMHPQTKNKVVHYFH